MKNLKYIITLLLLSYWAYLSVLVLHEGYLLSNYLNKITLAIQQEKQNQNKQNLEESAKSLCAQNQSFEKYRLERRNPLLKYWATQQNTEKYANPWGISYEYLYIEWLEEGFSASEINTKIVAKMGEIPQNSSKRRRETLVLGLFLLIVYLAGEVFNFYKTEGRRKKLRLFKSLGFFGGAVLGAYLAMLLTGFVFNFVILIALFTIPLIAFLGEKMGLMIFNLMKKK